MIAYKIKVNGKHIVTCGQEDWSILFAHLTARRENGEREIEEFLRLSLGGLSEENDQGIYEHFRWSELALELGDKIEIEIVDVQEIDLPKKRYRSDKEVQENPFTDEEWKELRYQDYLELKKEFEDNVG
jgi:hypothetical protein